MNLDVAWWLRMFGIIAGLAVVGYITLALWRAFRRY